MGALEVWILILAGAWLIEIFWTISETSRKQRGTVFWCALVTILGPVLGLIPLFILTSLPPLVSKSRGLAYR